MRAGQAPRSWGLSDGSRLVNPKPQPPNALQLRQWALLDGQAYRIVNLRQAGGNSRLAEFHGHEPVLVTNGRPLTVFEVVPPEEPAPPGPACYAAFAPAPQARQGRKTS